jgi:hypothetical protein
MRRWVDNVTKLFKTNWDEETKLVSSVKVTIILEIFNSRWRSQRFGNWIHFRHQGMDNGQYPVVFIVTHFNVKHSDF